MNSFGLTAFGDFFTAEDLKVYDEDLKDKSNDSVRDLPERMALCKEHSTQGKHLQAYEMYRRLRSVLIEVDLSSGAFHNDRPIEFFTLVVRSTICVQRYSFIWRILADMEITRVRFNIPFYETVVKTLAANKRWPDGLRMFEHLRSRSGLEPSMTLLSCCLNFAHELGDASAALYFFRRIADQTRPTIRQYMCILKVHASVKAWDVALRLLEEMIYRADAEGGVAPDSIVVNIVLSAIVAAGKLSHAQKLVYDLGYRQDLVLIDRVGLNTLIKGYAQQCDLRGARNILNNMKSMRIEPDERSFNTVMDAAVRSGQLKEAWAIHQEMASYGVSPDKCSHTTICKGLLNLKPSDGGSWLEACVRWAESNFAGLRWNKDQGAAPWELELEALRGRPTTANLKDLPQATEHKRTADRSRSARRFIDDWDEI